ncbi:MAG: 2,3-bisphosphoglycerate-independent phosphoglycerate mutase [Peptostreptococcaceae bacterium]|nr:2,3-bisphosphoglycerate-independent phosphoglycerate mutase [Peptostreptococcaceae bacterium]
MRKPVALIILDGFAIIDNEYGNAVSAANKPNFDYFYKNYPKTTLGASGNDVGLPDGQMGNSEVGHLNIGAGRIVYQELTRISKSIADGDFFENQELLSAMQNAKNDKALHLLGLLSDGGVHSHINHLKGLLDFAKKQGLSKVYVHAFTDGRDTPPKSGISYIAEIQNYMNEIGVGELATVSGRYYAMDRDNRWERVEKAYRAVAEGKGILTNSAKSAVENSYIEGVTDEFIVPLVTLENYSGIQNGDSVIFFNFRPDRARELTRAIVDDDFQGFERQKINTHYVTMTQYDVTIRNVEVAFKPETLQNTFGEFISKNNLTQLRIAETEKYPHVTFFFNGGRETEYAGESRILVASPKVPTYDLKPEMSAFEVTDRLLADLASEPKDVIVLNYANCDMVGHTGVFEAAVKAVESVDDCIGRVIPKILEMGGAVLLTADHGNAEQMLASDGTPFTAHTTNRVTLLYIDDKNPNALLREDGILSDLAPTMLDILDLEKPAEMLGKTLIKK